MRAHVKAAEPFEREDVPVGQARERFLAERQDYKVELIDDLVTAAAESLHREPLRDGLAVHQRAVHRPLPRAARAEHQDRRRLQAELGRRRLLARGLHAHDADAHLRHGVLLQGRARGAPRADRAGQGARPPQARARARAVQLLGGLARRRLLDARRHHDLQLARRAVAPDGRRARLRRGQDARRSTTPSCGGPRGTGTSTARTCSRSRSRVARWPSSR